MQNIYQKINSVLNEEKRAYIANSRISGGLGSFNQKISGGFSKEGVIPKLLEETSSREIIQSKNAVILLKLYSLLNPSDKKKMELYLIDQLKKDSEYFDVAYLIFFILHRINKTTEALQMAKIALSGDSNHEYSNLLGILSKIVTFEWGFFDTKTYDKIELILQDDKEHNFQLLEKINSARVKLLEIELEDVNLEINYDRDKIINIWNKKFPGSEIPIVINEIEEYFQDGKFSNTKFATCNSRIRVVIAEVTKKLAVEVSIKNKDNKITEKSKEHTIFDYLRSKKIIDENEWEIIKALFAMASDTGSHATISNREYARLIKNIAYEIILLLLSKKQ